MQDADSNLSPIKRALLEVREMRAKLDQLERARQEPIAIVGLGCRLPGASSPDAYWDLLHNGIDAISDIPRERWNIDDYFDADPDAAGRMYVRHGGFISAVDRFDPQFFGITPREAAAMDPQQRLLLEVTWEALEHAGIPADSLMGARGGVFIGISTSDYLQQELRGVPAASIDAYLASGGCPSVAAGRLAYVLGLQGPAVSIDTACSSSLVAVHAACQSLRSGESTLAVAGGVSLMLVPELTINFCRARMLAADGRCKTFDKAADGYVRSEGCGVVLLKRLSDAVAAGDRILALVRGSAVNQDGRSSGLTVPNGPAQEAVIREALRSAGLTPADVQYVEAHGTGTSLGDPIEVRALARALGEGRGADDPVIIGSAKTNLGHLEAAAGVAGMMKLVLSLQHREIPRHLHFNEPNPHVEWASLPVRVASEATAWPTKGAPRIGGVSSFGFCGTNAHVIIQEAPATTAIETFDRPVEVLALSARTEPALLELASSLANHIDCGSDPIADICYSANAGRSHFEHRLAVAAADRVGLSNALRNAIEQGEPRHRVSGPPPLGFLFTGQGSQYRGMGRGLYEIEPVFRQSLNRSNEILEHELGRSILPIVFEDESGLLDQTAITQPAIFALEYALFELWASWGVHPAFVMGHSLGEDVAACAAGVFGIEDGLRMIAARGRLMQALPRGGGMVAVFASEAVVSDAISGLDRELAIAAINGPESIALSGSTVALERVVSALAAQGIKSRPMVASHAFHSPLMDPILDEFGRVTASMSYSEPGIELISSLSGQAAEPGELTDPAYWTRHVRQSVRFSEAVRTMHVRGCRTFLEIGPAPTLLGLGRRCVDESAASWIPSLRKGRADAEQTAESLAALYVEGVPVDWRARDAGRGRSRVTLPTYPFQRERYWALESTPSAKRTEVRRDAALSAWNATVTAADDHAARAPFDLMVGSYATKWASLEELTTAYMVRAFRQLNVFSTAGERATAGGLLERCEILAEYRTLISRWLGKLATEGLVRREGDEFTADRPLPEIDVQQKVATAAAAFADYPSLFNYVAHCGGQLVEVLTGKESPLETLFPGGSDHLARPLYETSPVARYFNGIVRAAVAAAAGRLGSGGCRVLEIGAGTGGTTAAVVPAISDATVSYTFTDVGALFLAKAQERFAAHAFMDYAQLDIERDPESQGFRAGSYDVIVAANVLHATRNLHATIDRTLRLLAPGGVLVLLETTTHPSWFDVSTGLIHGWQIFEDELRGDHPLLAAADWTRLLNDHGALAVHSYPSDESPAAILGQHVFIAQAPLTGERAEGDVVPIAGLAQVTANAATDVAGEALRDRLVAATPEDALEQLVEFVRDRLSRVLRLEPEALGTDQRLMDLGVDSLMAVELRNLLVAGLAIDRKLPATLIFDYPTIEAIAAFILREVLKLADAPRTSGDRVEDAHTPLNAETDIESMGEDEVEALLNKTLGAL